jgi:alpha,alpha-trehalase
VEGKVSKRRQRRFDAVLLDLDGVVTRTAEVHARSWKRMFDEFLRARAEKEGGTFEPFDVDRDYPPYVDGKPRYDGVRSFLESRGIRLPEGERSDDGDRGTVCGLGNRKDRYFVETLQREGARVYEDAIEQIRSWRSAGLRTAIVSSSRNCAEILEAAGASDLFEVRVDGVVSAELGLKGKPAPDIFLEAARRMGVEPGRAVVVEDATSGVAAGRAGRFGLVVGVNRADREAALLSSGADLVVSDLRKVDLDARGGSGARSDAGEPPLDGGDAGRDPASLPAALGDQDLVRRLRMEPRLAVFLDYDGTLTPIVSRPELAVLSDRTRSILERLAARRTVAIVSGRDRRDVENLVGLKDMVYAGSHGFDIAGPGGLSMQHDKARECLGELDAAQADLGRRVGGVAGVLLERKRFGLAVHYRNVADGEVPAIERDVDEVVKRSPRLMKKGGKKVFELRPRLDWNKGKAVRWLLQALKLDAPDVRPIFIGDDLTDEDAFRELEHRGVGILVGRPEYRTFARHVLRDPGEVEQFLLEIAEPVGD